jgi:hypothetical protein
MSTIVNRTESSTRGTTPNNQKPDVRNKNLKFVDKLDGYKVHHDDTDIRKFEVRLSGGEKIGEVEGLLADVSAKFIRYAEIEVEEDVINRHTLGNYSNEDRHVLVPIGLITVNKASRTVTINGIELEHMIDYPRFNRDNGYTTSYELDTNNYLSGFHEFGSSYNRGLFDTDRFRQSDTFDDSFYASKFYTGR